MKKTECAKCGHTEAMHYMEWGENKTYKEGCNTCDAGTYYPNGKYVPVAVHPTTCNGYQKSHARA